MWFNYGVTDIIVAEGNWTMLWFYAAIEGKLSSCHLAFCQCLLVDEKMHLKENTGNSCTYEELCYLF